MRIIRNIRSKALAAKYWSSAGIMLTDWCNAACASCYLRCSPERANWISVDSAVRIWQELESLSPHGCRVHLTGGEPFGDWERLLEIARLANAEKLILDKVETNAFWATDEKIIRQRVTALAHAGMRKFSISADPFHQQFVPIDRPRLAAKVAEEVLGVDRVQVRWETWLSTGCDLTKASPEDRNRHFRDWLVSNGRDRMNGRAAEVLAELLPEALKSAEAYAECNCRDGLLRGKQIHVGPEGYIMPGVCAGLVIGRAAEKPVAEIWRGLYEFAEGLDADYSPASDAGQTEGVAQSQNSDRPWPVLGILATQGPFGLLKLAEKHGFSPAGGYGSKCHLCWSVRRFLHQNECISSCELGPGWLYSEEHSTSGRE